MGTALPWRAFPRPGTPPKDVEIPGRWHGMSGQGFAIAESSDAKAMGMTPVTGDACLSRGNFYKDQVRVAAEGRRSQ